MFGWHRLGLSPVGISAVVDDDSSVSGSTATTTRDLKPLLRKQSQSIVAQPSETALRLSRAIADKCQTHAFGGGLRPFGASLLLAGGDNAQVAMCETHPNGGWRSSVSTVKRYDSKIEDHKNCHQIMVSGGPVQSQHKLKSLIQSKLRHVRQKSIGVVSKAGTNASDSDDVGTRERNGSVQAHGKDNESIFLRQVLHSVVSALVEEWENRGDPRWSSSGPPSSTSTGDASKRALSKSRQKNQEHQQLSPLPLMEVVIASPGRGTMRLTQSDVARLVRSTTND